MGLRCPRPALLVISCACILALCWPLAKAGDDVHTDVAYKQTEPWVLHASNSGVESKVSGPGDKDATVTRSTEGPAEVSCTELAVIAPPQILCICNS